MRNSLKFIDLFAGLGGFHLALSHLGCQCVFASELKEDLQKLYRENFPGTPILGDITKVSISDIPAHDILCGGFPCQPFSQAGKRQGFYDEKNRGNLFYYIADIIRNRTPRYVFLENVANLKGHDDGNTWDVIYHTLSDDLDYEVDEAILSPHEFGIPQHRKRIYIVAGRKDLGGLGDFRFPEPTYEECDIRSIIDESDTSITKLKPETRHQLSVWQEFIDKVIAAGDSIPTFPIWAMEFGATYNYEGLAPAYQNLNDLVGKKGKLGKRIYGDSISECLITLPNYAQTRVSKEFPNWKKRYICQNREFYQRHKKWLTPWLKKVADFDNSHLKLEWNCGDATPTIEDKIIQFRASGIRVKMPTFAPALNLVGTQTPIIPWVKLPQSILSKDEPDHGRYLSLKELSALQGMEELNLDVNRPGFPLSLTRASEALGNAVNVKIVETIAQCLLNI